MAFQSTVNRRLPFGIPGEVVVDGPWRASTARVKAVAGSPAIAGRAFGYDSEVTVGTQNQASYPLAIVGGANFLGILTNPKEYTLYGNTTDGPLGPSMELPEGQNGTFVRMGILTAEVYNGDLAAKTIAPGTKLYYCLAAGTQMTGSNVATTAADVGKLFALSALDSSKLNVQFALVPGGTVLTGGDANQASNAAALLRIQLTN